MQTYSKEQLVEFIRIKTGQSSVHTKRMVEATFDAITTIVAERHGEVNIAKFGKFIVSPTKEKIARNPRTGTPITVLPSWRVSFKASAVLKKITKGK